MIRTRVGYAGGTTASPTYERIGDHTETIQVDFDPDVIDYAELLQVFWARHNPGRQVYSQQYRSLILTHDARQERLARASLAGVEREHGQVSTAIEAFAGFTRAEDYHQKFTLRRYDAVMADLRRAYPAERDFVDSTAAARLNGYLAGKGDPAQLERELPLLGLSPAAQQTVRERVGGLQ